MCKRANLESKARAYGFAQITAAVYNTLRSDKSDHLFTADDFLSGEASSSGSALLAETDEQFAERVAELRASDLACQMVAIAIRKSQ